MHDGVIFLTETKISLEKKQTPMIECFKLQVSCS